MDGCGEKRKRQDDDGGGKGGMKSPGRQRSCEYHRNRKEKCPNDCMRRKTGDIETETAKTGLSSQQVCL